MIVNPHPNLQQQQTRALIHALEQGLPLSPRPYNELAKQLGMDEQQLIDEVAKLQDAGIIKRMGVVVRHRKLGYRANAMVVWDIPDEQVSEVGCFMGNLPCVTLSYRRPRRLPQWPYNLFTMIHGDSREKVLDKINELAETYSLNRFNYKVLFSKTCYKQRGAHYVKNKVSEVKNEFFK